MKIATIKLGSVGQFITSHISDDIKIGDYVILEIDRGIDYGEVLEINEEESVPYEIKNILRKATPEDLKQIRKNKQEAKEAIKTCAAKAKEHNLSIKLIDAEYSFDKKKIVFYFVSDDRVDFRNLVKDLAKIFKIRIEMRQIGVRDHARFFGGIGICGGELCCVRFLKNFEAVTMKMAKLQKLPLTAGKISGVCGRLMCCLFYEHNIYSELSSGLPKEGQTVQTEKGKGKVTSVNVLKRLAYIEFEDGSVEKVYYPLKEEKKNE